MSQLTDRLERDLREIAAGAHPSPSAWESISSRLGDDAEAGGEIVPAPNPNTSRRPTWIAAAAAVVLIAAGSVAVLDARRDGDDSISSPDISAATMPATNPSLAPPSTVTDVVATIPPTTAPFVGIWESTDTDGSSQTMDIVSAGGDEFEVVVRDEAATAACAGAPSTITGTGRLASDERLAIAQPELTCDDGTTPAPGPPPQADLANFTFVRDPATDEIVDPFGVVWRREGATSADTSAATMPVTNPSVAPPSTVADVVATIPPASPFVGIWLSTDTDGSAQTMSIDGSGENDYGFMLRDDDFATACSGHPARMTGTGRLETDERLVIAQPELSCDDGTMPPPQVELASFTLELDTATDELVDSFGVVWQRGVDGFPYPTSTFVSPRNGFSVKYPERRLDRRGVGTVTPAKQLWGFSEQVDDGFDVVETGLAAVFKGASTELTELPDGVSIDERVDDYFSDDHVLPGGCSVPRSQQAEITIDGQSGRIAECQNHIEATVVAGGRLYLFTLSHDRSDARAVFDAFVANVDLRPETAVDFPGLTTTFVSPTYGYSFGYIDRGGLAPATDLWDPVSGPLDDINLDDRFDAVETGLFAYFEGASTEIPNGVSIDEWVDEYVSPGGCGVPRSQQAEITIDGRSGRIAECQNQIEATVAAGGRLYLFILSHSRPDARAFFDAFAATIDLTPETAAVP